MKDVFQLKMTAMSPFILDLWSNIWSKVDGFRENCEKLISGSGAYQQISLIFAEFEKFRIRKPFKTEAIFCQKMPLQRMLRIVGRFKNFELQCILAFWPRPFPVFYAVLEFCILAQEYRRGSIFNSKWPQCPQLY